MFHHTGERSLSLTRRGRTERDGAGMVAASHNSSSSLFHGVWLSLRRNTRPPACRISIATNSRRAHAVSADCDRDNAPCELDCPSTRLVFTSPCMRDIPVRDLATEFAIKARQLISYPRQLKWAKTRFGNQQKQQRRRGHQVLERPERGALYELEQKKEGAFLRAKQQTQLVRPLGE